MKKLIISIAIALFATWVSAAQIWWVHHFSDDAVVHGTDGIYSITEYAENVLGDSLYNVAYMVKDVSKGTYLNFKNPGFEDPDDYTINWVEGTGDGHPYIRNNQVCIGSDGDLPDSLIVELHLYDEVNDSFTKFAYSDIFNVSDLDHALYYQSGLGPDADVPTSFVDFYTTVPEPSTALLVLLGVGMLFKRRQ